MGVFAQRKQFTEYLGNRVLVEAMLAPHADGKIKLDASFERYMKSALPYLGGTSQNVEGEDKKVLDRWTAQKGLKVRPNVTRKLVPGKIRSALKAGAQRVQMLEKMRRAGRMKSL